MIGIRQSSAQSENPNLRDTPAFEGETNTEWLARVGATRGLLLLGGTSVSHFRIRVAQSHVRSDLRPSCWSLAGILLNEEEFVSVPLAQWRDVSEVAIRNGVTVCKMDDYDDPAIFPNIAVIRFTEDHDLILEKIDAISRQRSIIDMPNLLLAWLSYVWIVGKAGNPLADGLGLPSAVLAEMAHGIAGIELTPGLASAASCPEAIWQAAKWWHEFYEQSAETAHELNARPQSPSGEFTIRQKGASVLEVDSEEAEDEGA